MNPSTHRLLAVDIGQSGSRVKSSDGFEFSDGPAFDRTAGLPSSVRATVQAAGNPKADVVALSLTGVRGQVPNPEEIGKVVHEITGAKSVAIADDGLAALAGALGGEDGVAIAIGSGVVAVAKNNGKVSHRDGDGPILGDDGSGFWIGREGLRAAVRAHEDRGPQTALLANIEKVHGLVYQSIRTLSDAEIMKWCLQVTPIVLETASQGDGVAQSIRAEAVKQLAATLDSAWRAVGEPSASIQASFTGAVMSNEEFKNQFFDATKKLLPGISWQSPRGDNLDGALNIASAEEKDLPPLLRWWKL